MDKLIAHVFPNYAKAYAHLRSIWEEQNVLEIDSTRLRYKERDGTLHRCFVVRCHDDIQAFFGFEFFEHHVHDDFHHLKPDDLEYMNGMLRQRTRHVPEVA